VLPAKPEDMAPVGCSEIVRSNQDKLAAGLATYVTHSGQVATMQLLATVASYERNVTTVVVKRQHVRHSCGPDYSGPNRTTVGVSR
jgi:hypothetical protein